MRNSIAALGSIVVLSLAALPASPDPITIDHVDDIAAVLDGCVVRGLSGQQVQVGRDVTLRVSFRRDGVLIGEPFVTYSRPAMTEAEQARYIALLRAAIKECSPLPFSKSLGAAIAGRIFTFRYTIERNEELN